MKQRRTLANLHALDGLVVHRPGARLDELVALRVVRRHMLDHISEQQCVAGDALYGVYEELP